MSVFLRIVSRLLLAAFIAVSGCALVFAAVLLHVYDRFDGSARAETFECAIVLGMAAPYGQAGPGMVRRLETALRLHEQGKVHLLYFTGGTGEGLERSEAEVMKRLAMEHGVSASDIILEEQSHSTEENLRFTRPLTSDCGSVIAISDRYHLARIELLAQQQGWKELQTYPADRRPEKDPEWNAIVRETMAYLYYALRSTFPILE